MISNFIHIAFWKRILWNKRLGTMKMQHWRLMIASALCYHCVNSIIFSPFITFYISSALFISLFAFKAPQKSDCSHWLFRFLFGLRYKELRSLWRKAHLIWFVSTSIGFKLKLRGKRKMNFKEIVLPFFIRSQFEC